jgi:hypothetical protein
VHTLKPAPVSKQSPAIQSSLLVHRIPGTPGKQTDGAAGLELFAQV